MAVLINKIFWCTFASCVISIQVLSFVGYEGAEAKLIYQPIRLFESIRSFTYPKHTYSNVEVYDKCTLKLSLWAMFKNNPIKESEHIFHLCKNKRPNKITLSATLLFGKKTTTRQIHRRKRDVFADNLNITNSDEDSETEESKSDENISDNKALLVGDPHDNTKLMRSPKVKKHKKHPHSLPHQHVDSRKGKKKHAKRNPDKEASVLKKDKGRSSHIVCSNSSESGCSNINFMRKDGKTAVFKATTLEGIQIAKDENVTKEAIETKNNKD